MNKVLIKLYIPTLGLQYDIWIAQKATVDNVIKLIVKGLNELTYGEYNPRIQPNVYNKNTGLSYDLDDIVEEVNIINGTELMLM